jgi:hypothetical protein
VHCEVSIGSGDLFDPGLDVLGQAYEADGIGKLPDGLMRGQQHRPWTADAIHDEAPVEPRRL